MQLSRFRLNRRMSSDGARDTTVNDDDADTPAVHQVAVATCLNAHQQYYYGALVACLLPWTANSKDDANNAFSLAFLEMLCTHLGLTESVRSSLIMILTREVDFDVDICVQQLKDGCLMDDTTKCDDGPNAVSSYAKDDGNGVTDDDGVQHDTEEAPNPDIEYEVEVAPTPTANGNSDVDLDVMVTLWQVMQNLISLSVSSGAYDSRSRALMRRLVRLIGLPDAAVFGYEDTLASYLRATFHESETQRSERRERQSLEKRKKWFMVGLAGVVGATVIGLTGGLAAPAVAIGGAALFGTGSAFLATTAGVALVASLFGAAGGGLASYKMKKRMSSISDFSFVPVTSGDRMNVVISVTGWITSKDNNAFMSPWQTMSDHGEIYSLVWESKVLESLGSALSAMIAHELIGFGTTEVLKQTLLVGLMTAVALSAGLLRIASIIDNPWSVGMTRAQKAGAVLADVLEKRIAGCRPVTLVGFSLGARVIFYALKDLASRKSPVYGVVEDVFLFGTPVSSSPDEWRLVRSVVAGRLVNGFVSSDWVLSFLYRSVCVQWSIAGLKPITEVDVENVDLSDIVDGHMSYRAKMPHILYKFNIGEKPPEEESTSIPTVRDISEYVDRKEPTAKDEPDGGNAAILQLRRELGVDDTGKPLSVTSSEAQYSNNMVQMEDVHHNDI